MKSNNEKSKHIDLSYLLEITNSNSKLLVKMITIFLKDTPPIIAALKSSMKKKDWISLHGQMHSLIPTFQIMGMNRGFEKMTQKILDFKGEKAKVKEIKEMVAKLETDCVLAFLELNDELKVFEGKMQVSP